jgi:hypothetical protein
MAVPTPLLQIPPEHQPLPLRANGMEHAVLTWATIPRAKADAPAALLHLSTVGPYAQLKALWAHVLTMPARILHLPQPAEGGGTQRVRASRLSGIHGRYHTHWNKEPLPQSGQSHLSLTHDVALDGGAGTSRVLLQPLHGPINLPLVVTLLDRHLALPLPSALAEEERAAEVWNAALAVGAITPLPAFGCRAFWIATEHPSWPRCIIAVTLGQGLDAITPPVVTTHGSAYTVGVPLTAVDEDEQETNNDNV